MQKFIDHDGSVWEVVNAGTSSVEGAKTEGATHVVAMNSSLPTVIEGLGSYRNRLFVKKADGASTTVVPAGDSGWRA